MQAVTLILEGEHNIEVKEQVRVPFFWEISSDYTKKDFLPPFQLSLGILPSETENMTGVDSFTLRGRYLTRCLCLHRDSRLQSF